MDNSLKVFAMGRLLPALSDTDPMAAVYRNPKNTVKEFQASPMVLFVFLGHKEESMFISVSFISI